jgi:hypothetical protein
VRVSSISDFETDDQLTCSKIAADVASLEAAPQRRAFNFINKANLDAFPASSHDYNPFICDPTSVSFNVIKYSRVCEKLIVAQLVKKFPDLYVTRSFIAAFERSWHQSQF